MPFQAASGVLSPDLAIVQNVYNRIIAEPWVAEDPGAQEQVAKSVINVYSRGTCEPETLFRLCLVAAKQKLSTSSLGGALEQAGARPSGKSASR
jgi:hypothetical protein